MVVTLPYHLAGMELRQLLRRIRPMRARATSFTTKMRNSMRIARWFTERQTMTVNMVSLSATGSRNCPRGVIWWKRRAKYPSSISVSPDSSKTTAGR